MTCSHANQHAPDAAGVERYLYACGRCGRCYPCEHTREPAAGLPKIGWRCADGAVRTGYDAGPLV